MLDSLYNAHPYTIAAFGAAWCGPEKFDHMQRYLVARYDAPAGSDGQSVEVFCSMAPADFYILQMQEGTDSLGEAMPAYELRTGSGMAKLDEPDWDSGLIDRCRQAWSKPLRDLSREELATLLRQRIAVEHILPIARQRVQSGADDDTEMYDGELESAIEYASHAA